jgi:hypothetical protein
MEPAPLAILTSARFLREQFMRFVLVVYLFLAPGSAPHPVTIPQSTQASCAKAAERIRAEIRDQEKNATVITACVDQGSAY